MKCRYEVRFEEENVIKTLKVEDKDTLDYIVKELENKGIMYVVIKIVDERDKDHLQWKLHCLLDF